MDIILEKKKGIRRKHVPYIVAGVMVLVGAGWLAFGNHTSKYKTDRDRLTIAPVTRGEFNDYIRVNGQVQPINTVYLSAIEGGTVAEKVVEEGVMVRRGDVIVRLVNPMLSLTILDSEAQLAEKQNFLRNTQVTMEQEKLNLRKEKLQLDLDVERKRRKSVQYASLYAERLVSLPLSAVWDDKGKSSVWIYNPSSSTVSSREVKVKQILKTGEAIVEAGVKAGETVVAAGVHSLQEGMKVTVLPKASETNVGGLL